MGLAVSSGSSRDLGPLSEHSLQIPEEGLVSGDLQAQCRVSKRQYWGGWVEAAFHCVLLRAVMLLVKSPLSHPPSQC